MISRYLHSLSTELRVPARRRARIVAEVRDHLHEAVAAGQSEHEAVEAFGDSREVAARFHEQLASSSARRASAWTAVLLGAFVVAMAFAPAGGFPSGIVIWVGAQLAAVAGALGVVRWLRYRSESVLPAGRLADVYRANGLAVACVGIVGLAVLVDGHVIVGAAMLAAALVAGVAVSRSIARARVLSATAPAEDAFDDLAVLAGHYVPRAVVSRFLDLRRNPWRFCLLFAAACGFALAAQHALVDGGVTPHVGRALLAGLIIASIEAAAVVACYAAFGRFLGIRR
jgi:hypothetical protein